MDELGYMQALKRIDELWASVQTPGDLAAPELLKLVDEVIAYEEEHYPFSNLPPQKVVEFRG